MYRNNFNQVFRLATCLLLSFVLFSCEDDSLQNRSQEDTEKEIRAMRTWYAGKSANTQGIVDWSQPFVFRDSIDNFYKSSFPVSYESLTDRGWLVMTTSKGSYVGKEIRLSGTTVSTITPDIRIDELHEVIADFSGSLKIVYLIDGFTETYTLKNGSMISGAEMNAKIQGDPCYSCHNPMTDPTGPDDDPFDQGNYGSLCGNYGFSSVGNSYTSTFYGLGLSAVNGSQSINVEFGASCISIPNYTITSGVASNVVVSAYNSAVQTVYTELNSNMLTPNSAAVQIRLKTLFSSNLNSYQPGSTFSTGPCLGNVYSNTASYAAIGCN